VTEITTKTPRHQDEFDAVLLIAFGGPNCLADVRPFLANVVRGRPVPPERIEEVVKHYERIGGRSPLTELTMRQADGLRALLQREGPRLPVYVGMRNWDPYLRDTLAAMQRDGVRRAVGVILAAQQSDASWGRYQRDVETARSELNRDAPAVDFAPPWYDHPGFIEAVTAQAASALPTDRRGSAHLIFTAHSIPTAMAQASPYERQLHAGAGAVAKRLGFAEYLVAYQSRSGNPREPWLGPDIVDVVKEKAARGVHTLLVVPIGFVCDHVEVLYDLDVEARQTAAALGVELVRAPAVNDHPDFIRTLAAVVAAHVRQ
jgi:ferrochelatase